MLNFLYGCFFLSGASSLVLETVWTRELGRVFGSTTLAMATVLSVFMGGLGLGSFLAGKIADRIERRALAYAIVEALIGVYALGITLMLAHYPAVNAAIFRMVGDGSSTELTALRFLAATLVLLIPTTCMGATLPILSRHFVARAGSGSSISRTVGSLYAVNTVGAVAGTFLGGFVLLPNFGERATNAAAAITDLALALAVLFGDRVFLARGARLARSNDFSYAAIEEAPPLATYVPSPAVRRAVLWAFACSGATAMIFQVLWTRSLVIVIGSSVYSFSLILLAFLIGLSAGAALVARLTANSSRPLDWLIALHLMVAVTASGSYLMMDKLPQTFLAFLRGGEFTVDGILFCQFLLAVLALLPCTLCMGGVLPLTIRIFAARPDKVGEEVGKAYAMNTVGAIVGSAAAGFAVLPIWGLERGLKGTTIATVALAAILAWIGRRRILPATLILVSGCALVLALPKWDLRHFSSGLFRISIARDILEAGKWPLPELDYYKDGIATTVSVERWGKTIALKNNGKVDASNGDDMATQIMVGLMPLIFHQVEHPIAAPETKPPRVAVIGYGSGVTIGAVTQFPIGHVDVVELEPAVVDAGSRFFGTVNHRPAENPKVRVIIGDGRNFLTQADDKYDAIVSEPSNPWITGVSNLFTVDYWKLARSRLADDGVFCQWAQLYEMSPPNIKTLLRSFSAVFPYTYIFSAEDLSSDVIMVAANHPLPLDVAALRRNWQDPVLAAELKRGGVESAEDLIAYLLLTPDEIPAFTAGAALNTDDNARIEFAAPRDLLGYLRYDPYLARVYGSDWPYGHFDKVLQGMSDGTARGETEIRLARALTRHGKREAALRFLKRAHLSGVDEIGAVDELVAMLAPKVADVALTNELGDGDKLGLSGLDPPVVPPGVPSSEQPRIASGYLQIVQEARRGAWAHGLMAIKDWPEKYVDEGGKDLELLIGFLLYKADMADDAVDRLKPLADDADYVTKRPIVLYYLARAEYVDGMYEASVRNLERYLSLRAQTHP